MIGDRGTEKKEGMMVREGELKARAKVRLLRGHEAVRGMQGNTPVLDKHSIPFW